MSTWRKLPGAESGTSRAVRDIEKKEVFAEPAPRGPVSDRLRLSTLRDCKREIRRLYISARNGELSTTEAGKMTWMISVLANIITDSELEERIEKLEGHS